MPRTHFAGASGRWSWPADCSRSPRRPAFGRRSKPRSTLRRRVLLRRPADTCPRPPGELAIEDPRAGAQHAVAGRAHRRRRAARPDRPGGGASAVVRPAGRRDAALFNRSGSSCCCSSWCSSSRSRTRSSWLVYLIQQLFATDPDRRRPSRCSLRRSRRCCADCWPGVVARGHRLRCARSASSCCSPSACCWWRGRSAAGGPRRPTATPSTRSARHSGKPIARARCCWPGCGACFVAHDRVASPHRADPRSPSEQRRPPERSVREVYRRLLRLGTAAGAARAARHDPFEHLPTLEQALQPTEDIEHLTDAYVLAGTPNKPASTELAALEERVVRVQRRTDEPPRSRRRSTRTSWSGGVCAGRSRLRLRALWDGRWVCAGRNHHRRRADWADGGLRGRRTGRRGRVQDAVGTGRDAARRSRAGHAARPAIAPAPPRGRAERTSAQGGVASVLRALEVPAQRRADRARDHYASRRSVNSPSASTRACVSSAAPVAAARPRSPRASAASGG